MATFERFRNATLWAMLVFAAVNACSYFVRSDVERLWGVRRSESVEAIGFPLLVWREPASGSEYFSYPAFATDLSIGVVFAVAVGLYCARRGPLDSSPDSDADERAAPHAQGARVFQFGVRSMLGATLLIALVLGSMRADQASAPWIMITGLACGPWMILASFQWVGATPRTRGACALAVALTIVVALVWAGLALDTPREFDRVLMALFVCWVPQCVLAAAAANWLRVA